ncbi:hypothetical protein NQD34_015930 [Periophthalmus magnuspinnatus]|nr:hypothetical protein NQD34_015930 [Periophthalmus magnuspinnatus]
MDFCSETVLILHERSHTGEQPYKCDYCGRWFGILGNLYGHIRTQHPDKELPEKERFDSMKLPYLQSHSQSAPKCPSNPSSLPPPQASSKSSPQPVTIPSSRSSLQPPPITIPKTTSHFSPQPSPITLPKPTSHSSPQPSPITVPTPTSQSSPQPSPKPPFPPPPQSPPNPSSRLPLLPPVPHVLQINLEFEKPYICEYCSKGFKTKHHLIEHRYIHIGKPFSCAVCGMGFVRKKKLEYHQKSHTGRDLFSCGECGYKFGSLQKLKTHKLKKHPDKAHISNDKYKCKYCDETYSHYCNLVKHMKEHNEKRSQHVLCQRDKDKEKTAEEAGPTPGPFEKSSNSKYSRAEKKLTCRDCGAVVKLGFTTLSNVFAVTKVSNVKCFLNNHKMI